MTKREGEPISERTSYRRKAEARARAEREAKEVEVRPVNPPANSDIYTNAHTTKSGKKVRGSGQRQTSGPKLQGQSDEEVERLLEEVQIEAEAKAAWDDEEAEFIAYEAALAEQEAVEWRRKEAELKSGDQPFTDAEVAQFQGLLYEKTRRRSESLKIYTPMPSQEGFHISDAPERSFRASNRAGKTLTGAVEVARAVTGQDPYHKYPESGIACLVGRDEKHCGDVMYKKLFKPGPFRVIRDLTTRKWRAYRPDLDYARRKERRMAPPLIPDRFYGTKDVAWLRRREEIPRRVVLNAGKPNEWSLLFFSSLGEAPQGRDFDLVWFDEEIEHPSWYVEMAMRLVDRSEYDEEQERWIGGKFLWTATPQAGTLRLFEIHKRAQEAMGERDPAVTEHTATLFDNIYLSNKAKEAAVGKLGNNDDEIKVRIYGEFALLGMRIYPDFAPKGAHGCKSFDIPDDWCRYISIDPGRQVCAVLFFAVPKPTPQSNPNHERVFIYDELYIKRCDAEIFADHVAIKIQNTAIYEAIIDDHAARITEMGSGRTIGDQYREALIKRGVKFENTNGVSFTTGNQDIDSGILAVRSGLHVSDGRSMRWIVFHDKCPFFIWEMENYCYRKDAHHGFVTDNPLAIHNHTCDCLRMAAVHGLPWRKPRARINQAATYAFDYLRNKLARKRDRDGLGSSIGVG